MLIFLGLIVSFVLGSIIGFILFNLREEDIMDNLKAFARTFCFVFTAFMVSASILMLIY